MSETRVQRTRLSGLSLLQEERAREEAGWGGCGVGETLGQNRPSGRCGLGTEDKVGMSSCAQTSGC